MISTPLYFPFAKYFEKRGFTVNIFSIPHFIQNAAQMLVRLLNLPFQLSRRHTLRASSAAICPAACSTSAWKAAAGTRKAP